MLWLKAFHIIFVVTWFAGLFYLPRLFVYHVGASDEVSHQRFVVMERRLLGITHLGGALAAGFGTALLIWWLMHTPDYVKQGWLHAKLTLVALLFIYHVSMARFVGHFRERRNTRSERWFRVYNEVPALLLIGIVVLVVVRPF
ncbi:MAG: CopD family protein [Rhodanobacteraceae bacterium]|nr:CopD family protein [Rhodanobacteraceae bacterium]MBP9153604.1 CopD family protein [Xanthomonadales bacterium]HQW82600.1 CopD family protein [Pseudomonadota bacterium]